MLVKRKIKTSLQYRALDLTPEVQAENPNIVKYRISSPEPYKRMFRLDDTDEVEEGMEVLDHAVECVDMMRMMDKAPFLNQHNPNEQIGVIESAELIPNESIKCSVRFSENPKPQEVLKDIKSGIRTKCSVGYQVKTYIREEPKDLNSLPIYRAVAWMPYEASSVSIPADLTAETVRTDKMEFETEVQSESKEEPVKPTIEVVKQTKNEVSKMLTKAEIIEIRALAKGHGFSDADVVEFVTDESASLDAFKSKCLAKNHAEPVQSKPGLGLDTKEVKKYSLAKVFRAFAEGNHKDIGFEMELSRELQKQNGGTPPRSIYVPFDVLMQGRAGLNSTASTGGYTIQQDVLANEFIDVLRPEARVIQAGARVMSGLQGNVLIPKLAAAGTCGFVAEDNSHAETDQTFAGPTLSPKTLSGWTKVGRQLLVQSSNNIEAIVRDDLTRIFGLAVDKAALFGSGSSYEPKGIIKMAAPIASQLAWTSTAVPSWTNMVALESVVTGADALVSDKGAYITNATMIGKMKYTSKSSAGYPVFIYENGKVNEYPCFRSNQFASAYATTCMFGDWTQLVIGVWGNGINMLVDPFTYSDTGALKITALTLCDIQVRHEESFAFISDTVFS